jgi:predicted flap endonuclease-1-like 5' DNA nuclease
MTASSKTNQIILAGEIARLEAKLADNALWCELNDLASREANPEEAARRAEIEAGLAADPVYRARSNLLEALELLGATGDTTATGIGDDRALSLTGDEPAETAPHSGAHHEDGQDAASKKTGHPAAGVVADDLTRIRGVDAELAGRLAGHGVSTFSAIAAWTASDVAFFARELAVGRRISTENWIEQAALLLHGERMPAVGWPVPESGEAAIPLDDDGSFRAEEDHAAAEVGNFATGGSGAIAATLQDVNVVTATAETLAAEIPAADDWQKPEARDSGSLALVESFGTQEQDDTAEPPGTPEQEPLKSLLEPDPQPFLLSEPASEEGLAANRPEVVTSWALEAAMGDASALGALNIESAVKPVDGLEPDTALEPEPGTIAAPETLEQRLRRLDREAERLVDPAAQSGKNTAKPDHGLARFIARRKASKARLADRTWLKVPEAESSVVVSARVAEDVEAEPPPPEVMVEAEEDRPAPGFISRLGAAAEGAHARPFRVRHGESAGRIEEASVEIVRKDVPLRRRFNQLWEETKPKGRVSSITALFLKALKGD